MRLSVQKVDKLLDKFLLGCVAMRLAIVAVAGTVFIIYCLVLFALDGGFAIK